MCFIFARTRTTPEDFRSVKQKNEKEENGSCTKKFLDGGVVCSALTSTLSSRKCYVCGATPTEMNKLEVSTRKEIDVTVYICICLSTLHACIRFFECLLHISYKLEVKKWQIRIQDREKVQQRKQFRKGSAKR